MAQRRRSKDHVAKINAFQKLFGQLASVKKHDLGTFRTHLYSAKLICEETRDKADAVGTLSEVQSRLHCDERVFGTFITVLSQTSAGRPDFASELRSCYEEQLKQLPEDSDMVYSSPSQVRDQLIHTHANPTSGRICS